MFLRTIFVSVTSSARSSPPRAEPRGGTLCASNARVMYTYIPQCPTDGGVRAPIHYNNTIISIIRGNIPCINHNQSTGAHISTQATPRPPSYPRFAMVTPVASRNVISPKAPNHTGIERLVIIIKIIIRASQVDTVSEERPSPFEHNGVRSPCSHRFSPRPLRRAVTFAKKTRPPPRACAHKWRVRGGISGFQAIYFVRSLNPQIGYVDDLK